MESNKELSTETSQENVDPISFFNKNNDFVLAYKKTEKLASAVYMITNLFSDNEPMKWTLRKKAGELLSFILTYKDTPEGSYGDFIYNTKTFTTELISFLEISLRGGLVSQMNFSILKQEFLNLLSIFNNANPTSKYSSKEMISKDFFNVLENYSNIVKSEGEDDKIYKTPESIPLAHKMSFSRIKDINLDTNRDNFKKTNRQNIILDLLKKRKELTIRDMAIVIKDCSEKTIQRELNSFISIGILKRTGVRRWSRYSLV
ncbi:MAG: hypothetical protein WCW47_03445 [Candidatus Paceibacterota bacterium]|jgi:hypothetical protein